MTRIKAMQLGVMSAGLSFMLAAAVAWAVAGEPGQPGRNAAMAAVPVAAPLVSVPLTNTPPALSPAIFAGAPAGSTDQPNLRITNDVRVYQKVKDTVVNIISSHTVQERVSTGDLFQDLNGGRIVNVQATSLGSGFVIHPDGYVITNEHVVDQGTDHECVFSDGQKLKAEVIAVDNQHDLAVLKVNPPKPLKSIELGSSDDLMIGEPVYAIGNPFGFAGTMTRGIVSALNRSISTSDKKDYKGLIQTDASINPGNSGGPLLNAYGQVVGINTAIRQGAEGIGFAIAVSNMRDLLPAFLNAEALHDAQVGFTVEEKREDRPPSEVLATVKVEKVQAGSAAEKAGLRDGDRLVSVDHTHVTTVVDALVALAAARAGDTLDLDVLRDTGKPAADEMEVRVNVAKAPPTPVDDLLLTKMGIHGQTITPKLVAQYNLQVSQGVFVDAVKSGSPAGKFGIQPGDVLLQLGLYRVSSVDQVATLLKTVKDHVDAPVVIIRGDTFGRGMLPLQ